MRSVHTALLDNWFALLEGVEQLDEHGLLELLIAELDGKRRKSFIARIHQRFNRVRAARERKQLQTDSLNTNHLVKGAL